MDGTIRRFFVKLTIEKVGYKSAKGAKDDLLKKIVELPHLVNQNIITQAEANSRQREYKKKLKFLSKY